jgi:DNA-binding GntR family transcriptional regulator
MRKTLRVGQTTLSREAYRALRTAILERRLPAGRKLVVRVLAEELGLSPTPIKEALAALEREGLVVAVPHRGYHVPRITAHDIEELYALREVVEGLAAARAAERADGALVVQLDRLLTRQRAHVRQGDIQHYGDLDLAFHQLLREASGNARLARVAESFNGQIRLLFGTSAQLPGRLQSSLQEHVGIVRAVKAGDPGAAEAAMRHHVKQAGIALLAYLSAQPAREGAARGRSAPAGRRQAEIVKKMAAPPVVAGSMSRAPS